MLGFDGSRSRDSTALVAASVEQTPQLWTLEAWERPATARHDWQVPRAAVAAAVMAAAERYDVRELAAAYRDMAARLGPQAIVAPMAPPGVEMILGATRDADFGPIVIIGFGGVRAACHRC